MHNIKHKTSKIISMKLKNSKEMKMRARTKKKCNSAMYSLQEHFKVIKLSITPLHFV